MNAPLIGHMKRVQSFLALLALLAFVVGGNAALAAPAPNDSIRQATRITVLPHDTSFSTREATSAASDPALNCIGGAQAQRTVWYRFRPSQTTNVRIDTFESTYDTVLAVYTGPRWALSEIQCNDDAWGSLQSEVVLQAQAGTEYYIMVGQYPGGESAADPRLSLLLDED